MAMVEENGDKAAKRVSRNRNRNKKPFLMEISDKRSKAQTTGSVSNMFRPILSLKYFVVNLQRKMVGREGLATGNMGSGAKKRDI